MTTQRPQPSRKQVEEMLARAGKRMRNNEHKHLLRAKLLEADVKRGPSKVSRRITWSVLGALTAALLLVGLVQQGHIASPPSQPVRYSGGGGAGALADAGFADEAALESTSGLGAPDIALDIARQWIGDPETRRAGYDRYGDLLKKSSSIALLSNDKDDVGEVVSLFSALGGHIQHLTDNRETGRLTLQGEIPTKSLSTLQDQLKSLVGEKYFAENISAVSQLNTVLQTDSQMESIQARIDEIRAALAADPDEETRANLLIQLQNREAELETHEQAKLNTINDTHLTTININMEHVRPWWQTTSRYELEESVTGFEDATFGQQFWINVLFIVRGTLFLFSYTFWFIIPLLIWWSWNRIRWERLERHL